MITVYSSRTRRTEPIRRKTLRMFVCGPTVYDHTHLGHLRTYISFDAFVRFLRARGHRVRYLINITDIDDKIIAQAEREQRKPTMVARQFEREFRHNLTALRATAVDRFARASDHIPQIITQIKRLIRRGYAYPTPSGSVYFRTRRFKQYGQLSHQDINQLRDLEQSSEKESPLDFSLWKGRGSSEYEPTWASPWGRGRPGWHIEDTAITESYFGPHYELHGGGLDLIFPHHECEIAQQEAASGKTPFVDIWMHTGLLNVNGKKMSKSLGNFTAITPLLNAYPARFLRFFILSHHWRAPIDLTDKNLVEAMANYTKINEFLQTRLRPGSASLSHNDLNSNTPVIEFIKKFDARLDDDFNTAAAMNLLLAFINELEGSSLHSAQTKFLLKTFKAWDRFFGCFFPWHRISPQQRALIKKREQLRAAKKFKEADALRGHLANQHLLLQDTPKATTVVNLT